MRPTAPDVGPLLVPHVITSPSLPLPTHFSAPAVGSPVPTRESVPTRQVIAPHRGPASLHRRLLAMVALVGSVGILLLAWGADAAFTAVANHEGGLRDARVGITIGVGVLVLLLVAVLAVLHYFLARRISRPATDLAEAAEAVAAGDFTVRPRHVATDDEMGRLARAVGAMIIELRRLAGAIASSAHETTAMSHDITASSEQMAAAAGQIAHTASDLSAQSAGMAGTIAALAKSAGELRTLSEALCAGAHEGVERNGTLRTLALENRTGLDASTTALETLGPDVQAR